MIVGDSISGNDLSKPKYQYVFLLNLPLYLALPIGVMGLLILLWFSQSGDQDLLFLGSLVIEVFEIPVFEIRQDTKWYHLMGLVHFTGYLTGGYGINVAHELTHRTWNRFSKIWGRWILALSMSTDFSIEHVYGHHENVGTKKDPATARRGENVYHFIFRSWFGSIKNSWDFEAQRLKKIKKPVLSFHNQVLRGHLMSFSVLIFFMVFGGWKGATLFLLQAFWARALLEIVNYIEHYGLVRVENSPVEPKHSWNTNRRISFYILFSLTRHSAHHEKGDLPFWELEPYPKAPEMPYGYLTTIYLSLIPPLWFRIIKPKLEEWDKHFASPEEIELISEMSKPNPNFA